MDADFQSLSELAQRRPDVVQFWSHCRATIAVPRAPDFMFGPMPDDFTRYYYQYTNLWALGIFRARGFEVLGPYTLVKDGEIFSCPQANIHQAHQKDFLARFGDLAKPRERVVVVGQAALLAGPGHSVYGHWISDFLPKIFLLHTAGIDVLKLRFLLPNDVPRFGLAWLELLGIPAENLISYDPLEQIVWVEELLVPTTFHNGVRMAPALRPAATLLSELIALRHGVAPLGRADQRIFLSRGQGPQNRVFRDRERVEDQAARAGLTIVHPQNLDLLEQVRLFQGASMVVGEYGSAMHGTLFSPPGTVVCCLRGSLGHPGFVQSGFGHALDQPTGYVFGRNVSNDIHSEFAVSEQAFTECLELLSGSGCVDTFPAPGPHRPNEDATMSKLTTELRSQLSHHALETIYRPRPAPVVVESDWDGLLQAVSETIGPHTPIVFLEFGVCNGATMSRVVERFTCPDSRFVGFDSFVGLPESWLHWEKGAFSASGREPRIDDPRVGFVRGWYQNSVPRALERLEIPLTHRVLVHFDSDLYASTLFLLTTLWHKLDSYYFMFDDFIYDDCVAMNDFVTAYPVEYEFFAQTRGGGDPPSPDRVFGRMDRVPFQLKD